MRKFLCGVLSTLVGIALLLTFSYWFEPVTRFFTWLLMLGYLSPDVSFAAQLFVRLLTFAVSYGVVGLIFTGLGWFNSKAMKIVYFIISTVLAFLLTWLFYILETYWWIFLIVFAVLLLAGIVTAVVFRVREKKEAK